MLFKKQHDHSNIPLIQADDGVGFYTTVSAQQIIQTEETWFNRFVVLRGGPWALTIPAPVLLLCDSVWRHTTWSPSQHGAAVDEVRVLTRQLLKSTDTLERVIVTAAATAQQSQKRALELAVEHRVDDWVERTGGVSEPQKHLKRHEHHHCHCPHVD